MEAKVAAALVEAFACNARIAGMNAENAQRAHLGQAMAYVEADFERDALKLEHLAGYLYNL